MELAISALNMSANSSSEKNWINACVVCIVIQFDNIQVVRHQLFCCKTLNDLRNTSRDTCKASTSSSASHENKCHDNHNDLEDDLGAKYDICTHSSDVIKYKICFKDDTS